MSEKNPVNFFWFRRDLRLHDNTGLYHALQAGLPVQCVFVFDRNILDKLETKTDARVAFICIQLQTLNAELNKYGSSLVTLFDSPVNAWKTWISEYRISKVFTNHDYEPYARKRDEAISKLLSENNIQFCSFKDQVIFEKLEICKNDGSAYTVYTPYRNRFLNMLTESDYKSLPTHKFNKYFHRQNSGKLFSIEEIGFNPAGIKFPPANPGTDVLNRYAEQRDYPFLDATSKLSVHLRFGTVSIREAVATAIRGKYKTWLHELIWREFYQMILWNFPHVAESAFKPAYNRISWRNDETEFNRWCEGITGYPIVDAGMRELNTTGFMHNRVRMITASFLTKHLLIDWRWGEAYFAKKLLDYDLAANNGGWQWSAGSGCDAAPYFRIFNPAEQTRKFDPRFQYIRKWVPEFMDPSYPPPVVEHKFARERCLRIYAEALKKQ